MEILTKVQQHLIPFAVDFFRLCVWLVLLMVIFVPLERIFALHPQKIFRKAFLPDLAYYFLSSLLPKLLLILPMATIGWALHFVVPGGVHARVAAMSLGTRFAASLVVGEIGFYWGHRWSHEIPFLWRFHAVHHSAEHVNFLVNARGHPVDVIFTRLCGLTLLYATGLASPVGPNPSLIPMLVLFIGSLWSFFFHATFGGPPG